MYVYISISIYIYMCVCVYIYRQKSLNSAVQAINDMNDYVTVTLLQTKISFTGYI